MATTNECVARIKRRLSRSNTPGLDATIIDELAATQETFEGKPTLPSFLVTIEDFTLSADDSTFFLGGLVQDFIRFHDDTALRWEEDPTAIEEYKYGQIRRYNTYEELVSARLDEGVTEDRPRGWAQLGRHIYVRPIPSTTISFRARFYYKDALPVEGNSTLWTTECPDLMIAYTGFEVAQSLRDKGAIEYFATKLKMAQSDYIRRLAAEEMAGLSTSRGDD